MLRTLAGAFLRHHGFRVHLAEDGKEAVEIFRREQGRIDLVLLDLTMPRLSGREALRQLREIDPQVRVLFTSGFADAPLQDLEREGAQGFVAKPYRENDLIQAVRAALERPRA
jgi:CheY-like chemotaxis protein